MTNQEAKAQLIKERDKLREIIDTISRPFEANITIQALDVAIQSLEGKDMKEALENLKQQIGKLTEFNTDMEYFAGYNKGLDDCLLLIEVLKQEKNLKNSV